MTTRKQAIIVDMFTALSTITGVNTVEYVLKDWQAVGLTQFPWIGISPDPRTGTREVKYSPTKRIECEQDIIVIAHLAVLPGLPKIIALADMEDAIKTKLSADVTRSNNAKDTRWISSVTDEADALWNPNKPTGSLEMIWRVSYYQYTTAQ